MEEKLLLEMRDISKSFPGVRALNQMQLKLRSGEVLALMGENGAGKSTLMNILCGALRPDEGEIYMASNRVSIHSIKDSIDLGIKMIHQELNYVPTLTVYENIFLGRELRGRSGFIRRREMAEEAQKQLDSMGIHISSGKRMGELSVSQQQMVEIIRAVSSNCKVLIMDEPTSAITSEEVRVLFSVVRKLRAMGVGIIFITHKMNEVYEIADRITVMRDGNYVDTIEAAGCTESQLISMMVGREITEMFPKTNTPTEVEVFRAEKLSGEKFKDISFHVNKGEILGVAGLMGAGRTEMMRAIFGLDKLHSGRVYLSGRDVTPKNTKQAIASGIGYVSEDRRNIGLVVGMSVKDNITMSSLSDFCKCGWIDSRKEVRVSEKQIVDFTIKTPGCEQIVANLSGGNQQKVVLSKTLLCNPEVIILDEPTRGIDVGAKAEIHRMISALARQGKGVIMISSEMPEILGMSDRIMVIHEGRKKGELMGRDATQEKIMTMILSQEE